MPGSKLIEAARAAVDCERATGCPAELSISQWALESGWGAHSPGNNSFGIKAYKGCYGVQSLLTNEFTGGVMRRLPQDFATFATLGDCFIRHARLITTGKPYAKAWASYQGGGTLIDLVNGIGPIYATAPNYAAMLLGLIRHQGICDGLAAARLSAAA